MKNKDLFQCRDYLEFLAFIVPALVNCNNVVLLFETNLMVLILKKKWNTGTLSQFKRIFMMWGDANDILKGKVSIIRSQPAFVHMCVRACVRECAYYACVRRWRYGRQCGHDYVQSVRGSVCVCVCVCVCARARACVRVISQRRGHNCCDMGWSDRPRVAPELKIRIPRG